MNCDRILDLISQATLHLSSFVLVLTAMTIYYYFCISLLHFHVHLHLIKKFNLILILFDLAESFLSMHRRAYSIKYRCKESKLYFVYHIIHCNLVFLYQNFSSDSYSILTVIKILLFMNIMHLVLVKLNYQAVSSHEANWSDLFKCLNQLFFYKWGFSKSIGKVVYHLILRI